MKTSISSKAFLLFFFLCFFIVAPSIHAQKKIKTENGVTVVYNSKDPVGKKDKESFVKVASEEFSGPVFTDDLKKIAIKQIKYPKYKPAYQSFSLMENGRLAVSVDSVENEYTLFDIFDQEGRYIAHFKATELTLPAEGIVSEFFFFFKNGKAYAVATEDDYRFAKRYNFEIQEYKDNKWVRKK